MQQVNEIKKTYDLKDLRVHNKQEQRRKHKHGHQI